MSIPDIFKKIKGSKWFDVQTGVFFLVVVGVGVSAFGLGRLSMAESPNKQGNGGIMNNPQNQPESVLKTNFKPYTTSSLGPKDQQIQAQSGYVASKNGKLYYTAGCSGAKRIKPANEVWFTSPQEAERLGYTRSSSC